MEHGVSDRRRRTVSRVRSEGPIHKGTFRMVPSQVISYSQLKRREGAAAAAAAAATLAAAAGSATCADAAAAAAAAGCCCCCRLVATYTCSVFYTSVPAVTAAACHYYQAATPRRNSCSARPSWNKKFVFAMLCRSLQQHSFTLSSMS
eukprot:3285074-Pleurochrysis_carterae.AAC.4